MNPICEDDTLDDFGDAEWQALLAKAANVNSQLRAALNAPSLEEEPDGQEPDGQEVIVDLTEGGHQVARMVSGVESLTRLIVWFLQFPADEETYEEILGQAIDDLGQAPEMRHVTYLSLMSVPCGVLERVQESIGRNMPALKSLDVTCCTPEWSDRTARGSAWRNMELPESVVNFKQRFASGSIYLTLSCCQAYVSDYTYSYTRSGCGSDSEDDEVEYQCSRRLRELDVFKDIELSQPQHEKHEHD